MDEAETSAQPRFTPGVFATVAAADDFLLFKHIMVNKNVELELETRAFFVQAHQAKLANQQAEGQPQQLPPRPPEPHVSFVAAGDVFFLLQQ